jgi:RHS repeat-associated protein
LGQLTRVDEPNSSNALGTVTSPNQPTAYTYDTLNNLLTVTQAGSGTEQCGPAGGTCSQTRTFSYSSLSRLLSAANLESGTISYGYDWNGNLTAKTDARGVQTANVYDALNRVTQRNYTAPANLPNYQATPNVTYRYDGIYYDAQNQQQTASGAVKGKLTSVSSDISRTNYTAFDILGRVSSSSQITDGQTYSSAYAYNPSGAMIEETYPSGRVVTNTLDSNGDLQQVQSRKANGTFQNYANSFNYTAAGAVGSMRLGNGKWENTTFNSRLQPVQIGLSSSATNQNLLKLDYDYGTTDNNGNVKSQQITVPTVGINQGFTATQTYTYDSLNRLKDARELIGTTQTWKQTFTFDRYGNRNFDEANTTTLPKFCNNNTQVCPADRKVLNPSIETGTNRIGLDQDGDSVNDYNFDSSGNITHDAQLRKFTYDGENKQVKVETVNSGGTVTGTVGEYVYDGDGKRVKKISSTETTIFVYDASGKSIAEYSTVVASSQDAKVAYLTADHLGSPRINTDANGAITARHDYHPFGEEVGTLAGGSIHRTTAIGYNTDSVRKKFTGYERDLETNLNFAEARMLGSELGRFSTPDEFFVGSVSESPQSWNLYSYVLNNPLKYTDPTGRIPTDFIDLKSGVRTTIEDNIDQVIAATADEISKLQKLWEDGSSAYYSNLRALQNSNRNQNMTGAQLTEIASIIFAECSVICGNWGEPAGIFGALRNRSEGDGLGRGITGILTEANDKNQVSGALHKDKFSDPGASQSAKNNVYKGIANSIYRNRDFSDGGSGGAFYWHGTDFHQPTAGSKAYENFYRVGFQFTNPSHDLKGMGNHASGKGYVYKYESTAAYGQTTFMRLTSAWSNANGTTNWRGTRYYENHHVCFTVYFSTWRFNVFVKC